MKLNELFNTQSIAAIWNENVSNTIPYLGEAFFTTRKQAGLDLKWIKGYNDIPVTLAPSTFDSKARFRDRIGIKEVQTEMPFFREGFQIKEKDRQDIMRIQSSNDPYAQDILSRIYNDANNLIEGARVVPERMIWQLLAPIDGKPGISITANGVDYTYDYDPNNEFKGSNFMEVTTGKWSDSATADPIADLQAMMLQAQDNGFMPTIAVMSRKTFNYMLKAETMKNYILAQNVTANIIVTDNAIKSLVMGMLGLNIIIYEKKYKDEDKNVRSFMPDDIITVLPEGTLGTVCYGTTPEEADLMSETDVDVSIVNTGVAITSFTERHPVEHYIYASEIVLPTFERMNEVFVMKVA